MAADRHRARILAMQALCHLDAQGDTALRDIGAILADAEGASHPTRVLADRLARQAWSRREASDAIMGQQAATWDVVRMSMVDRNVVRVALAELAEGESAASVVFDEAIEIAREFSTAESPKFVHGLLDATWKVMSAGSG